MPDSQSNVKPESRKKPSPAEERLVEVAERLRTRAGIIGAAADDYRRRKRATVLVAMIVADLNGYALALNELADFAETGK